MRTKRTKLIRSEKVAIVATVLAMILSCQTLVLLFAYSAIEQFAAAAAGQPDGLKAALACLILLLLFFALGCYLTWLGPAGLARATERLLNRDEN